MRDCLPVRWPALPLACPDLAHPRCDLASTDTCVLLATRLQSLKVFPPHPPPCLSPCEPPCPFHPSQSALAICFRDPSDRPSRQLPSVTYHPHHPRAHPILDHPIFLLPPSPAPMHPLPRPASIPGLFQFPPSLEPGLAPFDDRPARPAPAAQRLSASPNSSPTASAMRHDHNSAFAPREIPSSYSIPPSGDHYPQRAGTYSPLLFASGVSPANPASRPAADDPHPVSSLRRSSQQQPDARRARVQLLVIITDVPLLSRVRTRG